MAKYEIFKDILNGSKEFTFDDDNNLVITGYYSGESITLNLDELDEDAFEQILVED